MGFSGINPDKLAKTISSLDSDQKELRGSVSWIKSSFGQYGIDTEPLVQLGGIASWAEDQLPGLRRRLHLSIAEHTQYGVKGYVRIDEAKVGAAKQSVADGKKAGEKWKDQIEKGDISPEVFATLTANSADADYLKGFYDALGPQALSMLSLSMGDHMNERYKDDPKQREEDRKVLADTFGTYTRVAFEGKTAKQKQKAWNDWFSEGAIGPRDVFRPDLLIPLLPGGKQDKDFLVALGDRVVDSKGKNHTSEVEWMGQSGLNAGEWGKDAYTQLFSAIGADHQASGEWMDHNRDWVNTSLYHTGPWQVDQPKERGQAFLKLLNGATVSLRDENPRLAEKNTAFLLYENAQHRKGDLKSVHPIDGTAQLYTNIITEYWKDLEMSVTSPVSNSLWSGDKKWDYASFLKAQDGSRPGIEVSQDLWSEMLVEAGRDPKGAGVIGGLFQAYDQQMIRGENNTHQDGTTDDAVRYLSARKGLMQHFYYENMRTSSKELDMDLDKWVEDTNAFRDGLIDNAVGAAAGGMGGAGLAGVKGAVIGTAYSTAQDLLTGWIKDGVHVDKSDAPGELRKQIKDVKAAEIDSSWQASYQDQANDLLRKGEKWDAHLPHDVRIAGTEGMTDAEREEMGLDTSRQGDPHKYIGSDPAKNFLQADGTVKDVDKMTPSQRQAYGDWLTDPAVVAKVYEPFADGRNAWDWPGQTADGGDDE
ncbi:hypothetical protein STTU_2262 [Streptomyces sp. Tu6071]|uniref:hypothetical protein n=1 Tax=Streptomyces sp. Tu6071 TaxID=355249 RepID=UPI00020E56B2|nr:hypothetical protein [Streptomyces sp. Tu6071]EGJ75052.1 hypothetical protein STTU_2262 [Streptomyces sp. Tu6071]